MAAPWVTLTLCVIIGPGCNDSPSRPSASNPALTETTTSVHYTIHSAPGDTVNTAWQDAYYEWLEIALQLQPSPRLDYYKYRDRGHLKALTGRDTNGFADAGTTRFHTIWPTDNHEGVHPVVILQIGHPPPLFTEGIAVAHQTNPPQGILRPRWNGTDLHVLARQYDAAGRLPAAVAPPKLGLLRFRFECDVSVRRLIRPLPDRLAGLAPSEAVLRDRDVRRCRVDARITLSRGLRSSVDGSLGRVAGVDQIASVTRSTGTG